MGYLSERSRLARQAEVWLGQREPESVNIWLPIPFPDLDESQKEILLRYWNVIETFKINIEDERVQDAINGHPHHLEDAFLFMLENGDKLKGRRHATNLLIKALQEGWKPNTFQSFEQALKAILWL